MVKGVHNWLLQRVSALILAVYSVFLLGFILHEPISYQGVNALFARSCMKIATVFVFLSLLAHAWIGLRIVITDYIKPLWIRLPLHVAIVLSLLGYVIWGIEILWGML